MEVKMLVGTDVIERKPGRLERRELGLYLGCKLSTDRRTGNRLECELHHSLAKPPRAIDKVGQALRWQGRAAVDQNHVQADPQARRPVLRPSGSPPSGHRRWMQLPRRR